MTSRRPPSLESAPKQVKLVHVPSSVTNNVWLVGRDLDNDLKSRALEEVLQSVTFCRAEQLRRFLRYVCNLEIEGKPNDISEHSIGVEALGRPADFVTSEDGIVRNRAHALRQKLLEYYAKENPEAPVQIELPKGSYVPRFQLAVPVAPEKPPPLPPSNRLRDFAAGALIATLLACAVLAIVLSRGHEDRIHPVIREAWGSLLAPDADNIVVISLPTHFILRPFDEGGSPRANWMNLTPSDDAVEWYKSRTPLPPADTLVLRPALAVRAGEVQALVSTIRVLDSAAASYRVLAEGEGTGLASMRGQNVVLAGDPQLSPSVARFLEDGCFDITFDSAVENFVIRERDASSPLESRTIPADGRDVVGEYPGLLTVMPSDPSSSGKRTVVFGCANSAGCHAAAEFFASPNHMSALRERLREEGIDGFPRAYQVLVQARAESQWLLSLDYVAHRVLDPMVD